MANKVLFEIEVDAHFGDLVKLDKNLDQLKKTKQSLVKQQKSEVGLNDKQQRQLSAINQEISIQTKERSKVSKELQQNVKVNQDLLSEYEKESARLNKLRKQLKDKILIDGKGAESTKKLAKEVHELDEVLKDADAQAGQFQRNVGNYPRATGAAQSGIKDLSVLLTASLIEAFAQSREASRELQQGLAQLGEGVKVTFVAIKQFTMNIAIPSLENFYLKSKLLLLKVRQEWTELKDFFTGKDGAKAISDNIDELTRKIEENDKKIATASNGFENYASKLNKTNVRLKEMLKLEDELINKRAVAELQAEILIGKEEQLQMIADDATKSFAVREEALRASIEKQEERLAIQKQIAIFEQDIAVKAIQNDLEREGMLNRVSVAQIKNLDILKDKTIADKISLASLEKIKMSSLGLQSILNEQIRLETETAKTSSELKQDRLEMDLDFAIDVFDNQKTINERLLAEEERTEASKQAILERTRDLAEKSFAEQTRIIEEFTNTKVDLNALVAEDDEKRVLEHVRSLGVSEIIETRLIEIVKEKRLVIQDLADAEKELQKQVIERQNAEEDSEFALMEFRKEVEIAKLDEHENSVKMLKKSLQKQKELIALQTSFELEQVDKAILSEQDKEYQKTLILEKELEERRLLEKKYNDKQIQRNKELNSQLKSQALEFTSEISTAVFDNKAEAISRQSEYEMSQLEVKDQFERDMLKSRLDSGAISQAEYENNLIAQKERFDEKNKKIQREAFERKKRLDTAQALINGALASINLWANNTMPYPAALPFNIATQASIAATTGVQVGVIQSQQFADGGLLQGNSHDQGGIPFTIGGRAGFEAEGGEFMVNREATAKNLPLLQALNNETLRKPNYSGYNRQFANGGLVTSGINSQDLQNQASAIAQELKTLRVINVASETQAINDNAIRIENEYTL